MANIVKVATPRVLILGDMQTLNDVEMQNLIQWVDGFVLSKEKRNLTRDFSDGVLVAEIIKQNYPKYVELHHFSSVNATKTKEQNWFHLNKKIFCRFGFELHRDVIHAIAQCRPFVVENVLVYLQNQMTLHQSHMLDIDDDNMTGRSVLQTTNRATQNGVTAATTDRCCCCRSEHQHHHDNSLPINVTSTSRGSERMTLEEQLSPKYCPRLERSGNGMNSDGYVEQVLERVIESPTEVNVEANLMTIVKEHKSKLKEQKKTIKELNAIFFRLEHLLRLKDIRIEDLASRLQQAGISV